MPIMAGAVVAAPVVGGLVGNIMSSGDRNEAKKNIKRALKELQSVGMPPDLSTPILYRELEKAGVLTPQLEEDLHLAKSEFENIKEDPHLRDTQLEALNRFKQQTQGGLQGDERAALNQIRSTIGQDTQAKNAQIMADAQRRGQGGGGAALIAQLQNSQAGANQASQQGDDLMKLLAERVRSGAQDMGSLGTQIRQMDYNKASDRARALDQRNQFQYTNSMARQARNVDRSNDMNQANLANAQRIKDANVGLYNQEQLRQRQEQGNFYDRKLNYAQSLANARMGQATQNMANADRTASMYSGIGQGVGQGLSAYAKAGKYSGAQSGYGGDEAVNDMDEFYMSKGYKE